MEISKVGVIGCGAMGSGIIQVCAQSGYLVIAREINNELFAIPTTGVIVGDIFYYLASTSLNGINQDGTLNSERLFDLIVMKTKLK